MISSWLVSLSQLLDGIIKFVICLFLRVRQREVGIRNFSHFFPPLLVFLLLFLLLHLDARTRVFKCLSELPELVPVLISSAEPLVVDTVCQEWILSHLRSRRTPRHGAGVVYCTLTAGAFHTSRDVD